ncbi:MAG: FAD-dependent oxidoreductase [Phycisphaeraceae bacterium]|nr:FAD-dependent oxidoreductase [Phycisphaeraceae bacterium]
MAKREVTLIADVDVVVIGAGSAGCCAAIAARQSGRHSVLLIDRLGFAGGTSTAVLDTFYGFYTPGNTPRKVVGGVPERVVDALHSHGAMFLRPNTYGAGTGVTYDPERLKLVWDQLLNQAGVELLLHTVLMDVQTDGGGAITGLTVLCRDGLHQIKAKRFIDCSGDAELCHLADVPYEKAGDIDPAQTMTTTFRMCGVDLDRYEKAGGKKMLAARMDEAIASGRYNLPRKAGSAHAMVQFGCVATVAVRVADLDGTDSRQLTKAEQIGREQAFIYGDFFRSEIPGYEQAGIIGLSTQIGVRETRRVHGEYRLTREDCMSVARFDDRVLLCGAPIEDHRASSGGQEETAWAYVPGGEAYDVPYRTLVPKGRDELWVAGRCFSATHDAHASCRSMGQTMSMGQAVGLAAAMSLESDCGARDVDVTKLQDQLRQLGAVLETPKEAADTSRDGWGKLR